MSDGALFREDALKVKQPTWLGGISIDSPVAWWTYSALSAAVALAAVGVLLFGSYTKRVQVDGRLVPQSGVLEVTSSIGGVVRELPHAEGDVVAEGQVLGMVLAAAFVPSIGDVGSGVEETLRKRSASSQTEMHARLDLIDTKMAAASARSAGLKAEIENLALEIDDRSEQVRLSQSIADRYRQASDKGYVSAVQLQLQETQSLEAANGLRAMQRQEISLRRELEDSGREVAELRAEKRMVMAEFDSEDALIALEKVRNAQASGIELRAPMSSTIGNINAKIGQYVVAGESILSLVAKGSPLQGEVFVSNDAIAFIKVGDRVALRYHSFAYQKFGHRYGTVTSVSSVAQPSREQGDARQRYRVTLRIDQQFVTAYGVNEPLRAGMTFDANVLGEKRRIYEWLLEPIYSVRGY